LLHCARKKGKQLLRIIRKYPRMTKLRSSNFRSKRRKTRALCVATSCHSRSMSFLISRYGQVRAADRAGIVNNISSAYALAKKPRRGGVHGSSLAIRAAQYRRRRFVGLSVCCGSQSRATCVQMTKKPLLAMILSLRVHGAYCRLYSMSGPKRASGRQVLEISLQDL
jgi:hypothetical protein